MPTLIVSTCGTSLLTNLADERRDLVIRHANAGAADQVPMPDRTALEGLIQQMHQKLAAADNAAHERLSAELNGVLRYYGGKLDGRRDTHWLIATDTWLGNATAEAIGQVLAMAGHTVEVKRIPDLRTNSLTEFRSAMAELARLCAQEVRAMREGGWRVVFNVIDPLEEYALAFRRDEAGRFGAGDVYAARETLPIVCLEQLEIDLCEVFDLAPEAPVTSPSQADTE